MKLSTKRLQFRHFTLDDCTDLHKLLSDKTVMRYSVKGPLTEEQTKTRLQAFIDDYKKFRYSRNVLEEKSTGAFVGWCGIQVSEFEGELVDELGYRLFSEYWGKGLATEASRAVLEWGFSELNKEHFLAFAEAENKASLNVLEKLGFKFLKEGFFKGIDVVVYKISRNDFYH